MARVAVLHNTLDLRGGADAVCLQVCQALQDIHDVVLFTISETSLSVLNELFGTAVAVRREGPPLSETVARAFSAATPWAGPQLPLRTVLLRAAFRRHADRYDLAVSTSNELALSVPSVQYVHFPQFHAARCPSADAGRLNGLYSRLAAPDGGLPADATVVANSEWTADAVATGYGDRPAVVYPPVDPVADAAPWTGREQGIVLVGRLAPDKRVLEAIAVVDELRADGYGCHLHLVGSAASGYRDYVTRVERAVDERPYVSLETDADRARVETLLGTHRFGLNMKNEEHFGMALAECVAAGMLAFAPDSGGQREIVGDEDRLFDTVEGAAAAIGRAIDRGDRPSDPRDRFDSRRFRAEIRDLVADRLDS